MKSYHHNRAIGNISGQLSNCGFVKFLSLFHTYSFETFVYRPLLLTLANESLFAMSLENPTKELSFNTRRKN